MDIKAGQVRGMLAASARPYDAEAKRAAVAYATGRRAAGAGFKAIGKELGVPSARVREAGSSTCDSCARAAGPRGAFRDEASGLAEVGEPRLRWGPMQGKKLGTIEAQRADVAIDDQLSVLRSAFDRIRPALEAPRASRPESAA